MPILHRTHLRGLGNDLCALVQNIDHKMIELRPHHMGVIRQIKSIIRTSLPFAKIMLYGSWPLCISIPSSDIDLVVDWYAGRAKSQQSGSWRAGLPPSIRGIGIHNANAVASASSLVSSSSTNSTENKEAFYRQTSTSTLFSKQEMSHGVCDSVTSTNWNLDKTPMEIVTSELSHTQWVRNIKFIHKSKVPVIKLRAIATGVHDNIGKRGSVQHTVDVDISEATPDHVGLRAKHYLKKQLQQWPNLRCLAIFLKQMLQEHAMSDASTGGLRSFALMLLLIRYYQHTYGPFERPRNDYSTVAKELLGFLGMYGNFDFSETGIDRNGFFSLREAKMHNQAVCCVLWGDQWQLVNVTDNCSKIFSIKSLWLKTKQLLEQGIGLRSLLKMKF